MKIAALIGAALLGTLPITASAFTLIHAFEFDTDVSDSVGAAVLTPGVGSTVSGGALDVPLSEGPTVDLPGDLTDYTIKMRFMIDVTSGWRSLIDFQNAGTDWGFYNLNGGAQFYNYGLIAGLPNAFSAGVYHELTFSRVAATQVVTFSVDGSTEVSFVEFNDIAVPVTGSLGGSRLRFLNDNSTENSAGRIDYIRIYESTTPVVPVPASFPLFLGAFAAFAFARRRVT